jgi:hypothetical protein
LVHKWRNDISSARQALRDALNNSVGIENTAEVVALFEPLLLSMTNALKVDLMHLTSLVTDDQLADATKEFEAGSAEVKENSPLHLTIYRIGHRILTNTTLHYVLSHIANQGVTARWNGKRIDYGNTQALKALRVAICNFMWSYHGGKAGGKAVRLAGGTGMVWSLHCSCLCGGFHAASYSPHDRMLISTSSRTPPR